MVEITEKEKIERVLEVFRSMINETYGLDFLWSDMQKNYIVIKWNSDDTDVEILDDPKHVCELFLYEIYADKYFEFGMHQMPGLNRMNEEQQKETLAAMEPYLAQLPEEYRQIAMDLLNTTS